MRERTTGLDCSLRWEAGLADPFDWKTIGFVVSTRTDLGMFLLASGLGATADAIWNFAPYAEFYAVGPWIGAVGLGAKKLIWDRKLPDQTIKTTVPDGS